MFHFVRESESTSRVFGVSVARAWHDSHPTDQHPRQGIGSACRRIGFLHWPGAIGHTGGTLGIPALGKLGGNKKRSAGHPRGSLAT